jgi:hypothetical protein
VERLLHLIQLERFDDRLDFFHICSIPPSSAVARSSISEPECESQGGAENQALSNAAVPKNRAKTKPMPDY